MDSLPIEIRDSIFSFLAPVEEYVLSQTCHQLHIKYNKVLFRKINGQLEKIFGDRLPDLKKIMTETGSVISGSFIAQSILNEYWEGDIDFYVAGQDNVELNIFMRNTMSYSEVDFPRRMNLASCDKVGWIQNYDTKIGTDTIVRIICIDINKSYDTIRDCIITSYDFDACKSVFYCDQVDKLYIHNLENILLRKTHYDFSSLNRKICNGKYISANLRKYKPYSQNGFTFADTIDINMLNRLKLSEKSLLLLKQFAGSMLFTSFIIAGYHIKGDIADESDLDNRILRDSPCSDYCPMQFLKEIGMHFHVGNQRSNHEFVFVLNKNDK